MTSLYDAFQRFIHDDNEYVLDLILKAIARNDIEYVKSAIINGFDVNTTKKPHNVTALCDACFFGGEEIVDLLLHAGANPNPPKKNSHHSEIPLSLAVRGNYYYIAEKLLRAGANPNISDEHNQRAIHHAANSYSYDMVNLLIRFKCDIDPVDELGSTPLICAVNPYNFRIKFNSNYRDVEEIRKTSYMQYKVIKRLIKAGADFNHTSRGGLSILHILSNHHGRYNKKIIEFITRITWNIEKQKKSYKRQRIN